MIDDFVAQKQQNFEGQIEY